MNKLMGFYELRDMRLPSIPWKEYSGEGRLDDHLLWTVRSAVYHGDDLNLPRLIGGTAQEARQFADELSKSLRHKGIVIYYPYFIADKSGTLNVYQDSLVIEAVRDDLWNLVTYSERDLTIQISKEGELCDGDPQFLSPAQKEELLSHVPEIRRLFRGELTEGKGILLEWSYAKNCDRDKQPVGAEYLVFYEARTII